VEAAEQRPDDAAAAHAWANMSTAVCRLPHCPGSLAMPLLKTNFQPTPHLFGSGFPAACPPIQKQSDVRHNGA
jgi:hypothetical protein